MHSSLEGSLKPNQREVGYTFFFAIIATMVISCHTNSYCSSQYLQLGKTVDNLAPTVFVVSFWTMKAICLREGLPHLALSFLFVNLWIPAVT